MRRQTDQEPDYAARALTGSNAKWRNSVPQLLTRGTATPPDVSRLTAKPHPDDWEWDELLTLPEAAMLLWPNGPLTVRTLRTAVRDGQLAVARIASKLFTTRRALSEMTKCRAIGLLEEAAERDETPKNRILTAEEGRKLLESELSARSKGI
jgi:hypothetical protein